MEPVDGDTMRALELPHGWITTGLTDPNHGLIVLMEEERDLALEKRGPKVKAWQSSGPKSKVTSNNLSLRCGVRHTPLPLGNSAEGEAG